MSDMFIGDRRINPPPKYADVAHCPKCDCDDMSLITIEKTWNRIYTWSDKRPEETQVDECILLKEQGYYCNGCEARFKEPLFRKEEVC